MKKTIYVIYYCDPSCSHPTPCYAVSSLNEAITDVKSLNRSHDFQFYAYKPLFLFV